MRNLLAMVSHGTREAVAAIVRTVFAQPDPSIFHSSAPQDEIAARTPARSGQKFQTHRSEFPDAMPMVRNSA